MQEAKKEIMRLYSGKGWASFFTRIRLFITAPFDALDKHIPKRDSLWIWDVSDFELKGASDFKLIDRRMLDTWLAMRERNLFFRGMTAWMGFRTIQVPFELGPRRAGKSGWSYLRRAKLALIGITTFSSFPLHFVTFAGVIFFIFAVGLGIQTLYLKLAGGEYLARMYEEVKGRPRYIATESIEPEQ